MKNDDEQNSLMLVVIGIIPVIWFALLVAPYLSSGLMGILDGVPEAMNHPFSIEVCEDSVKTVLIFLLSYAMGIGIYISTRKHYRRGEEHGSAKWGNVKKINRRYREKRFTKNKLLTMHVRISYNMRKHQIFCKAESDAGEYLFCGFRSKRRELAGHWVSSGRKRI